MNIIKTGGSGFIGNVVARELFAQGLLITSIDRRTSHLTSLKAITATELKQKSRLDVATGDDFPHLAALRETTGKQTRAEVFDTLVE